MVFLKKISVVLMLVVAFGLVLPASSHALMANTDDGSGGTGGGVTTTSNASTIAALQAQINALLAQIAALQAAETNASTSINLTVNGSNGPVTISEGDKVSLSWNASNAKNCRIYYPGKNGGVSKRVSTGGTKNVIVYPSRFTSPYIGLSCSDKTTGNEVHDNVSLVSSSGGSTASSCTITASKTSVASGEAVTIKWTTKNITNPVMYENVKAGGYREVAKSGSMYWVTGAGPTTDTFSIGTGGVGGINTANSPFRALCSVSVEVGAESTVNASATIDKNSLYSTSAKPTITGTAKGTAAVGFSISDGGKVYGSGKIPVVNGKWSHTVTDSISDGTYRLYLDEYVSSKNLSRGTLTIQTSPLLVEVRSLSSSAVLSGTMGTFTIQYKITAGESDVYVPANAELVSTTSGVSYVVTGTPSFSGTKTAILTSSAQLSSGYYRVPEAQSKDFTLTVSVDPSATGVYRVSVNRINYALSAKTPDHSFPITSSGGDFQTENLTIPNETTIATATYRGYMNGSLFITTNNINEADALANCKLNASSNPSSSIRCTWGDKEIYKNSGTVTTDPNAASMPIIVGVYEGSYPTGVTHSGGSHPEGTVTINIKGTSAEPAQPLVLTSYEPVNWVINNPNNVKITKIIAIGYYNQRVTNAPSGVSVQKYSYQSGTDYRYTYKYQDANHKSLVSWLETKFGFGNSGIFYGGYSGSSFDVSLGYKG